MELMKMIPVLVVVGGLGIAIGIYITSQIGEHINRRTTHKKFLRNMEWFDGETYNEGGVVTNRFSGEEYELTAKELSMYDFIMGATMVMEMGMKDNHEMVVDLRKGLQWFKDNNSKAYMVLLD